MLTEPKGVKQNYAPPKAPPELRAVARENWRMFATLEDAEKGLEMIRTVSPDAEMKDATEGQYAQFVYEHKHPDVRARLVEGKVREGGRELAILEYPSDIFDRSTHPQFFVDKFTAGEPAVLRCGVAAEGIGQLYWERA